jgi:hypothetical protein
LDSNSPQTFTIPISELQAKAARDEIDRVSQTGRRYSFPDYVCSTFVNQIMRAAGLGDDLYTVPARDAAFLGDAADTLAQNPNVRITSKAGLPIPDGLRGLQRDYAYVGGGYDTPSERIQRVSSSPASQAEDNQNPWRMGAAAIRFVPPAGPPLGSNDPESGQGYGDASNPISSPDNIRRLTRRAADQPQALTSGMAAPSFFDDRFGSWGARPPISDVPVPGNASQGQGAPNDMNAGGTAIPFLEEYIRYLNQSNRA